jgi:hypothetical protein
MAESANRIVLTRREQLYLDFLALNSIEQRFTVQFLTTRMLFGGNWRGCYKSYSASHFVVVETERPRYSGGSNAYSLLHSVTTNPE